jgi:hypothetical protein
MEVQINFDESSMEWRKNKNILKNGMFSYKKSQKVCLHIEKNGKRCRKRCVKGDNLCELHFN